MDGRLSETAIIPEEMDEAQSIIGEEKDKNYYAVKGESELEDVNKRSPKKPCSQNNDYMFMKDEILNNSYKVIEFLDRGSYGQVLKCWKETTNEIVAIKVMRHRSIYAGQGQTEADILRRLNQEDVEKYNFVRLMDAFSHKGSRCMVFEILERSLFSYLKGNYFYALPTTCIRTIMRQLLISLAKLQQLCLIHADIKPHNIMLVNSEKHPWRVKLIDFGCSMETSHVCAPVYIQTRYYRAPEIIMGFPFSESIDMWALGCVMAELFTGRPLYSGSSEYDQIRFICDAQGPLPECLLQSGSRTYKFFNRELYRGTFSWKLKTQKEYEYQTGRNSLETRYFFIESLDELIEINKRSQNNDDFVEQSELIDLLKKMLNLDPTKRITPLEALRHNFIRRSQRTG